MKDKYSKPIIGWTNCAICGKHQPTILAQWDDGVQPTCIHCLDPEAHEQLGEDLFDWHKQEEADNATQDIPAFA